MAEAATLPEPISIVFVAVDWPTVILPVWVAEPSDIVVATAPSNVIEAPLCSDRAPDAVFPMPTVPVPVPLSIPTLPLPEPVLMLVALLLDTLMLAVPPAVVNVPSTCKVADGALAPLPIPTLRLLASTTNTLLPPFCLTCRAVAESVAAELPMSKSPFGLKRATGVTLLLVWISNGLADCEPASLTKIPLLEAAPVLTVNAVVEPAAKPVTLVVPVRPMVLPLWMVIAPAAELPIPTVPVPVPFKMPTLPLPVPVFIFVAKLLLAFRLTVAPVTVSPKLPVISCVTVSEPALDVVSPALPSVRADALEAPSVMAPFVPVAVPESMAMSPELEVVPVALPEAIETLAEFVEAVEVEPELTLLATKASGTAVSWIRGVISPS